MPTASGAGGVGEAVKIRLFDNGGSPVAGRFVDMPYKLYGTPGLAGVIEKRLRYLAAMIRFGTHDHFQNGAHPKHSSTIEMIGFGKKNFFFFFGSCGVIWTQWIIIGRAEIATAMTAVP
ncbi:hypothetical protein LAD11_18520 [Escherichia coli]|nr:hypothetical protein [Escherichia coli]